MNPATTPTPPLTWKQRFNAYERLMRLDKPIGILLLLWPTLWGVWWAKSMLPNPDILLIFITGTVLMRSAGCVINDFADRDFDGHVERTKDRPLAAGLVTPAEALALAAVLIILAFCLVLFLNALTIRLSFAAVGLTVIYPFLKRVFPLPQAWLGISFGFGIPMAFAAQINEVPALAWWLLIATMFWAIAYDTEYAMVDRDDDLRIGVKSSAILFGRFDVAAVMLSHAAFMGILLWLGFTESRGLLYFAGLAVAIVLIALQYRMIRGRDRQRCFRAFLQNNWVGCAIFAGIATDLWFRIPMIALS